MLIIGHDAVRAVLAGRERAIIDLIADAYRRHERGESVLPHSVFLRFPDRPADRIIGLPGYLGGGEPVAGMKWISSFPGNTAVGLARASAAIVLNSLETGHPVALLEGSLISAARTAASAVLGARLLAAARSGGAPGDGATAGLPGEVTLVGCGVINGTVLRFLAADNPKLTSVTVHDTDPDRAAAFATRAAGLVPDATVTVARGLEAAVAAGELVSIATTASVPHMDLRAARPGAVVLHVSLRDLTTATVLAAHNVVDDPDHVCRERTSLHLAETQTGGRAFIDASIGQLLLGTARLSPRPGRPLVFSPFGLGVLDLALARHVHDEAARLGLGTAVAGFLPEPEPASTPESAPESEPR